MIHTKSSARFLAQWIAERYIDPWDLPDAIDCGFLDRLTDDIERYGARFGLDLVRSAQASQED